MSSFSRLLGSKPLLCPPVSRGWFPRRSSPLAVALLCLLPGWFAAGAQTTPTVSFSASGDSVREDHGDESVLINISPAAASSLTLGYTVSGTADSDDFSISGSGSITVPAEASTAEILISIDDDGTQEPNETIILTLNSGSGYTVGNTADTPGAYTLTIEDNDGGSGPTVTIAADNPSVNEGSDATFTLTANPAPTASLSVSVTVSQTGDFAASGETGSKTVTIGTSGTATLTVTTDDDSTQETNGVIRAEVNTGANYRVGSSGTASMAILDNDGETTTPSLPVVTVSAASSPITEGANASFTLTANPAPTASLSVSVTVAQTGDFATSGETGSKTVTIGTSGTATLTVAITDDSTAESSGSITATVNTGTDYTVGSPASATVVVRDNDGSNNAPTVAAPIPDQTATVGAAFSHTFPASTFNDADNDSLTYTETSPDWLSFTANTRTFSGTPRTAGTVTVTVTANDGNGGSVTDSFVITVSAARTVPATPATDTTPGSTPSSGGGGGRSDDEKKEEEPAAASSRSEPPPLPVVTITPGDAVTEGDEALFMLGRTGVVASALTVLLTVSEDAEGGRDCLASEEEGGKQVVIPAGSASAAFVVKTTGDRVDEPDGMVTVALRSSDAYRIGSPAAGAVAVNDDDDAALVASQEALALTEGGAITYTVALGSEPVGTVSLRIAAEGDAGLALSASSLTFDAANWSTAQSVTVTAGEDPDTANETGVIAHAAFGGGYDGLGADLAVSVADNDDPALADAAAAWLGRFGRAEAEQVLEGIRNRVDMRRRPASPAMDSADSGMNFQAAIAGHEVGNVFQSTDSFGRDFGGMPADPFAPASSASLMRNVFQGSSFNADRQTDHGSLGVWGSGAVTRLEGRSANGLGIEGDITTGHIGVDGKFRHWLFGFSLSHTRGNGDYSRGTSQGRIESTMNALTPYVSYGDDRFVAWGALSAGRGAMRLEPQQGAAVEMDVVRELGAVGLSAELLQFGDGFHLSVLSDAMAMRSQADAVAHLPETKASLSRLRAAIETSWRRSLQDGGSFEARVEAGARQDNGDVEEGLGGEIGGGVSLTMRQGLTIRLEGRHLFAHQDEDFRQTGASAQLVWDPTPMSDLGPQVSMRQQWGMATRSGLQQLFGASDMGHFGFGADEGRLDTELGWGLPAFHKRFVATSFLAHGAWNGHLRQTLGWRLEPLDRDGPLPPMSFAFRLQRFEGFGEQNLGAGLEFRTSF